MWGARQLGTDRAKRLGASVFLFAITGIAACGGDPPAADRGSSGREPGELVLPPSASAPRVMRESAPPDTFQPDTSREFAILDVDSLLLMDDPVGRSGPELTVDAIAESYRGNYERALAAGGSAVRNRIDRELQREAELLTARGRGFAGWLDLIDALSPEQRARLVDRLNEANIELARDLHASEEPPEPDDPAPRGG